MDYDVKDSPRARRKARIEWAGLEMKVLETITARFERRSQLAAPASAPACM